VKPGAPVAARIEARSSDFGFQPAAGVAAGLAEILLALTREPQNLTRILDLDEMVDLHIADSLVVLATGLVPDSGRLIDIGSGAGFPGIALAIARPGLDVTLLESEGRKADWLRRASASLPNVTVIHGRAETVAKGRRGDWSIATARAVGSLPVVIELAAPLLDEGGRLLVWRARSAPDEEARGASAADQVGFVASQEIPVKPFPGVTRAIHEFVRVAPTPDRFPRRDGRAASRPLT
jgi:16S rRNA (guanine527-N7)-methyltransferase